MTERAKKALGAIALVDGGDVWASGPGLVEAR